MISSSLFSLARARRTAARALVAGAAVALSGCMLFAKAPADIDYSRTRTSAAGLYRATIVPQGGSIPQGKLQSWTLHLENAAGAPVDSASVAVDGGMPQHGHGLPTRPQVTEYLGNGDYRVEGLKFHMPGWWIVEFDIASGDQTDHVTFSLIL